MMPVNAVFHGLLAVAPLKRYHRRGNVGRSAGLPRSSGRGSIEGRSIRRKRRSSPVVFHGLLAVAPLKVRIAGKPDNQSAVVFHGLPAVAPLKEVIPDRLLDRDICFHGYPAVATLKAARGRDSVPLQKPSSTVMWPWLR